ncbi:hypothetical protein BD413DRAFT_535189 [Trametes elegans]|nr:hypothetical protein BD413DRAFT_535189 [Trametes elegans]
MPFPGIGNNARMTVPITITSGLQSSLAKDDPRPYVPQNPANFLNLKPSYWDASH